MVKTNAQKTDWFVFMKQAPKARLRMFCFPYAGGGSLIYRTWADHLPEEVELCAIQLPGRESRFREAPFSNLDRLVEALAQEIVPYLNKPFAFFGHSMGGSIAFELARVLQKTRNQEPVELFVSARRAPQVPNTDPPMYDLPEAEFLEELKRLNGTPKEVLDHPELFQMMQPILRADFELCETYNYTEGPRLNCPITAFGGLKDVEVPRENLEPWREQTTSYFVLRMLPGDHFFLQSSKGLLLQMVSQELLHLMRSGRC